jgi:hypothetical protein
MLPNLTEKIAYYRDQIANHQRNIETLTELSASGFPQMLEDLEPGWTWHTFRGYLERQYIHGDLTIAVSSYAAHKLVVILSKIETDFGVEFDSVTSNDGDTRSFFVYVEVEGLPHEIRLQINAKLLPDSACVKQIAGYRKKTVYQEIEVDEPIVEVLCNESPEVA